MHQVQDGKNLCFPTCFLLMRTMHLNCVLHQEMRPNPPTHFIAVFLIGRLSLHPCFQVQATATVIDQNASFLKVSGGQQCEIEEPEMSLGVEEELSYQNGNGAVCLSKVSSTHKPDPFNPSKREGSVYCNLFFNFTKKIMLQLHSCNESKLSCFDNCLLNASKL